MGREDAVLANHLIMAPVILALGILQMGLGLFAAWVLIGPALPGSPTLAVAEGRTPAPRWLARRRRTFPCAPS